MTSLFKLFGAIESLEVEKINSIPVNQVKELRGKLLKKEVGISGLEFKSGIG
jgi:hypothetical protein